MCEYWLRVRCLAAGFDLTDWLIIFYPVVPLCRTVLVFLAFFLCVFIACLFDRRAWPW